MRHHSSLSEFEGIGFMNLSLKPYALLILVLGMVFTLHAVVPVGELARDSDVIVLARTSRVNYRADGSTVISLLVEAELKGVAPAVRLQAVLSTSTRLMPPGSRPGEVAGDRSLRLWFLRVSSNGEVLIVPAMRSHWSPEDAGISLDPLWTPLAEHSLEQQLLDAALNSFEIAAPPAPHEGARLIVSAQQASAEDALALAERILQSPRSVDSEVLGIAIFLGRSSKKGLIRLKDNVARLERSPQFFWIRNSLGDYYQPTDETDIRLLGAIVGMRNDISSGIDLGVARVLSKHRSRLALPGLVALLDSPDPKARVSAVHGLHLYATLAGPEGEIGKLGTGKHPFSSEETRVHSGTRSSIPLEASVAFWKSWWDSHRSRLSN